jgi:uncharacterized protein DUF2845
VNSNLRLVFCALLLLGIAPSAHALRCGSRLVSNGDYDFQARERCGDPFWTEDHFKFVVAGTDTPVATIQQVVYTAWFYNFGANRLIVRLLFRDGRLVREDTLDRGVNEIGDSCGPAKFNRGISSGELVAYCGMPISRNGQPGAQIRQLGPGLYTQSEIYTEQWVYDFGDEFIYLVHMTNGHVESVEHIHR